MRDNSTPELISAISAPAITTYIAARLAFKSETLFVWTGINAIQPNGSGDYLLDNHTFDPLVAGVMVELGENTFTMAGSNELTVSLNIPSDPTIAIAAAQTYPDEYQGREATLWRAIMVRPSDPLAEPAWLWRRIRSGAMDKVEIQADGMSHRFNLTIESHQANISNASNQTYLNQRDYDPTDASQDYAPAIANGDPAPSKTYLGGYAQGASLFGGVGGYFLNKIAEQ